MQQLLGRQSRAVTGQELRQRMIGDLPPVNTTRWVPRRKCAVVAAVEAGLLSLEDACRRYNLTVEEYTVWQLALNELGPAGLMTTKRK